MIDHTHYTYRVTWAPEDEEFVAHCVEFPSLSFMAQKNSKALEGIVGLVKEIVQDMNENKESIPTPLSERTYSGKFQLRIPPERHRILALEAAEQGVSLNRHISAKL